MHADYDDIAAIKLFKAVILQALRDACMVPPESLPKIMPAGFKPPKSKKSPKEIWEKRRMDREKKINDIVRERDASRDWLLGGSKDFRHVCDMAQWEPEYIHRCAKALSDRGWKMAKEAQINGLGIAA